MYGLHMQHGTCKLTAKEIGSKGGRQKVCCRGKPADFIGFQLLHNLEFGPVQVGCALQGEHLAENVPEAFNAEPLLVLDRVPGI